MGTDGDAGSGGAGEDEVLVSEQSWLARLSEPCGVANNDSTLPCRVTALWTRRSAIQATQVIGALTA